MATNPEAHTRARNAALAVLLRAELALDALLSALLVLWRSGARSGFHRAAEALHVDTPDEHAAPPLATAVDAIADGLAHALLFELADEIATQTVNGSSEEQTARVVSEAIAKRAQLVARVERAKAAHLAAMELYRGNGVQRLAWVGGKCHRCKENAAVSPIGINDAWPNGPPPTHPVCECAVVPA